MTTTGYALVYPTQDVGLAELTRAALAVAGAAHVSVVSGAGSQALRVPAHTVPAIHEAAGLAPDGTPLPPPPGRSGPHTGAPVPAGESPGSGAPTTRSTTPAKQSGRPAGRAGGRPAKKAAKKAASSTKEGDDQ